MDFHRFYMGCHRLPWIFSGLSNKLHWFSIYRLSDEFLLIFEPFWLHFGTQVGTMLATCSAKNRPRRPQDASKSRPRDVQEASWSQQPPKTRPDTLQAWIWESFGHHVGQFWPKIKEKLLLFWKILLSSLPPQLHFPRMHA